MSSRGSFILCLLLLAPLIVVGNVSITSAPLRSSPAVFQAGENVTLTCSSATNTYSWTSSFSESVITNSNITGLFLHGAYSGDHVCSSGENTATYTISVQGTTVWYNNPPPGRLLPNNTAISVYSDVSEVRCYTGDTSTNNDATLILTPTDSSQPLTFTNRKAGYLYKNGQTSVAGVTNGVYTCQYTNSSGGISYTSFAVFPRSREPSSGSSNTTSLEVQSVEYSTNNESIIVTCITTGWPATQVVWKHNNVQLSPGSGFTMNQRVMDREQCTYKNDLIVENSVNRLGTYRCEVKSLRHNNVTIDTTVGSVTVQAAGNVRVAVTTMGSQEVGESFYLNCTVNKINNVSLEIRWMKDNVTIVSDMSKGVMLGGIGEDADSVSRVLNLSPIRLSHTGQYSCDAVNGSAVDGRATIRVDIDAPYLSLSLDPSPDLSLTLGEEYTLMCAALLPDSLNPTVASITWYKDTVPFTSNGITTNLAEGTSNLNLGTVLSQEAGNYTCVANVSSPYIDTGYNLIVSNTTLITVSMPEPNSVVLALNYLSPPYYAGLRRDLQCSIDSLYIHNDPTVIVSVDILFNDTIVPSGLSSNGRKNLQQLSSNPSGGQYRKTLQFQYFVSSEDSGVYTCMVSVSSNYLSSYIVNASISRTNEYDIVAPKPAVLLNSTRYHLPNHPSYNTATLMCTATLQLITFDFLVFPKVLTWSGPSVSSATPATNPTGAVSESSLQQTYTTAGSYNYSCTVSVSVPGDPTASTTDAISVIVTAPSPPHSPVNTSAVNIRYNSATIRWIVPSIAYTPEEYVVLYGTNSTNMNDLSSVVNGSTNFSIIDSVLTVDLFDLTHDTVYHFRIRSTNTEGSTESDTNSFKTREKPPTAPPSNFTINTNTNSRSLSFSWDPPPPEHRNGDILAYNLTCYETVGGVVNLITTPSFPRIVNEGGSVQFVLSGFRPGTLVNCTLTSSNDAGTGPSATAYISTIQEAPGGPPLNFMIHTITSTNFTLSWEPPNLLLQYGTITGYTLSCTELERNIVPPLFPINYTPDLTNATVSGLRPFTAYSCRLTASNAVGAGPPAVDTPMTEPSAPSGVPQSLTLTLINSTTLTLSWLPIPELEQNGILTNYTVGCNQIPPQLVPVDDTLEMTQSRYMHNITGLRPGVVYSCYVFANTSEGNGPRAIGNITTGEDAPSSPPVNLTVSTLSHTSILIDWAPPSTPNGVIIAYTLYIDHTNGTSTTVNVTRKGSVIDIMYEYTALSPYQLVVVSVSAWTLVGEGPVSPTVNITTDSYIPGPVVDVTYTPSTDGSLLNVSFSSTNQPYSNGMIMNYTVSLVLYTGRDSIQNSTVNTSLDNVVVIFTALSKFVPYNVSIVAFNEIGRGQERTDIVFTAEGAPPKPTITDALRINGSTMFVKWILIPITESRGHISRYTIRYSPNSRKRQQPGSISVPGNRDSVYINGLRAGSTYSVTVSANTGGGEGNSSDSSFVELPPTTTDPGETSGLPITIIGAAIGAVILVAFIILIIIIVVCVARFKMLSKTADNAYPSTLELEAVNEKAELREFASLQNGNVEHEEEEEETVAYPEVIPEEERMKPIPRSAFSQHVKEMHREREKGFELEYHSLASPKVYPHFIAKLDCNGPKNRFANIYPFDDSRVVLSVLDGIEGSDYINASFIDGYNRRNAYIAAQGPIPNTLNDFWRMIWEHRLTTIVMLTKCIEGGKRKCEFYFPEKINETFEADGIHVKLNSITPYADFEEKKFIIENLYERDSQPLEISHWHFLGWPDHGCPQYATSLISFIRQVRKHYDKSGPPLLVHCSAGVGRTGTFILLDSMLERLSHEDNINVYEFLKNMRSKRVFMVQTLDQYVFIHDALDELITCGETDIPIHTLKKKIELLSQFDAQNITGFQAQFQLLEQVSRKATDVECSDALQFHNRQKNRYPDRVPYNLHRARLRPTGAQGSEYINASFIDGYKAKNTYIATQGPLQGTVHDFWRMIWEFKSKAIVLLCQTEENGVEVCYPFWPGKVGEPLQFNKLIVTLESQVEKLGGYVVRKLEIKEDKLQPVSFVVTLFQFKEWQEHSVPSSPPGLLTMLEDINKVQRNTGNKAITVICNDGQSRTGTFICIHAQQDRLKTENVIDIFHFIKYIRIQRSRMVTDLDQYIFCHQVLQEYNDKLSLYSNFK